MFKSRYWRLCIGLNFTLESIEIEKIKVLREFLEAGENFSVIDIFSEFSEHRPFI